MPQTFTPFLLDILQWQSILPVIAPVSLLDASPRFALHRLHHRRIPDYPGGQHGHPHGHAAAVWP
ncbi:hypothetical protein D3C75_1194920 [compost metagenome]